MWLVYLHILFCSTVLLMMDEVNAPFATKYFQSQVSCIFMSTYIILNVLTAVMLVQFLSGHGATFRNMKDQFLTITKYVMMFVITLQSLLYLIQSFV